MQFVLDVNHYAISFYSIIVVKYYLFSYHPIFHVHFANFMIRYTLCFCILVPKLCHPFIFNIPSKLCNANKVPNYTPNKSFSSRVIQESMLLAHRFVSFFQPHTRSFCSAKFFQFFVSDRSMNFYFYFTLILSKNTGHFFF